MQDDNETIHSHADGDQPHEHPTRGHAVEGGVEAMQLREEELRAQTTSVETGRVRLAKEVVAEQRTLEVPVTREEVLIERRPVDRAPSETPIGESDETIRVPVREEQVSVEKRPVVTEEISLGTRAVQETQRVTDTVRREEARVESSGEAHPHREA